jgi:hypothetical protein
MCLILLQIIFFLRKQNNEVKKVGKHQWATRTIYHLTDYFLISVIIFTILSYDPNRIIISVIFIGGNTV